MSSQTYLHKMGMREYYSFFLNFLNLLYTILGFLVVWFFHFLGFLFALWRDAYSFCILRKEIFSFILLHQKKKKKSSVLSIFIKKKKKKSSVIDASNVGACVSLWSEYGFVVSGPVNSYGPWWKFNSTQDPSHPNTWFCTESSEYEKRMHTMCSSIGASFFCGYMKLTYFGFF